MSWMDWTWCGQLNIQLPFRAWELEHIPSENLVHLVEKGEGSHCQQLHRERHKTKKGASHRQCLMCMENRTGAGDYRFEHIQHSSPFTD